MTAAKAGAPVEQHRAWMLENWRKYKSTIARFNDGLLSGRIDYDALVRANEQIILTWINAVDAGDRGAEADTRAIADHIQKLMIRLMNAGRISCRTCVAWWDRYKGDCLGDYVETDPDMLRDEP